MNMAQTRADIAKLNAETMRLIDEMHKTSRRERYWTPLLAASAALAIGTGLAAVAAMLAKLY